METTQPEWTLDPQVIESKWQSRWDEAKVWEVTENPELKKYYLLDMFPYPSGRLHMGHVRNYTIGDVIGRFRKAQGYNVLHPMGWDAFGLPAENAAIRHKLHPEKWTLENIQTMRKQLKRIGLGYDWTREVTTCLPEYYRWEQLIFTRMFEAGLAYKKSSTVNWCPDCQTVLANEQVEDGKCWRCSHETTTKELEQWFLKTTQYAEELLKDLDTLEGWPEKVKAMQRHWIGKSEGAEIDFKLESGENLRVFTTRPDTLLGVTYMAIAPESPLALELCRGKKEESAVKAFIDRCRKEDKVTRTSEDAPKEGVFTGSYALHPLTQEKVPIFIANFVLMDYGTGALMAVPAHDLRDHAFAKKYQLEIKQVIRPKPDVNAEAIPPIEEAAFTGRGVLIHSGEFAERFDGMDSEEAKKAIVSLLEEKNCGNAAINFKLRDWGLSRQRYWGAPIPIIHCDKCGPIAVPESDLPVVLPSDIELTGEGSPLVHHKDFLNVNCPKCSGEARRETDTMDTFMESSWYYLRYLSPQFDQGPVDPQAAAYWLGIDQYIGGVEHATMHLLYFRFFHKVLRDLGFLPKDSLDPQDLNEPCRNLMNQGIVYKDGAKMSKSKGNVVEPDSLIGKFGADTTRLFSLFAAPPEKILEWSDQGVDGMWRFVGRVWRMVENHHSVISSVSSFEGKQGDLKTASAKKLRARTHKTLEKIHYDFDHGYHFNTAIASIMELVNEIYAYPVELGIEESKRVLREAIETVVRLLHPFAPHFTEELWEKLGGKEYLVYQKLPQVDPSALVKDVITFVIQVNGKVRANIEVGAGLEKDKVLKLAQENDKVSKHLEGKNLLKTIFVPGKLVNFVAK